MNLFDFNIPELLHQRLCQFILHRYLGQFLERNLQLDQLSLNLVKGHFSVEQVALNVYNINEALGTSLIPLKLIDGYIGKITIDVPWTKIMADSTRMRIDDLQLTIQPKEFVRLDDKDFMSSMLGSVVESLVSSRELAKSFCDQVQDEVQQEFSDEDHGVGAFSNLIDAILSRFCLDIHNVTIRFENQPTAGSDMCTALEVRIEKAQFLDEQMHNCMQDRQDLNTITSQPQGIGSVTNLNKYITLSGVTMYADVFTRINQDTFENSISTNNQFITSLHIRRENKRKQEESPPSTSLPSASINADMFASAMSSTSQFQSCYSQLPNLEGSLNSRPFKSMQESPILISDPVKIGELTDEMRIILRIENNAMKMSDDSQSKVEAEMTMKSLLLYVTPSQLNIVRKFVSALSLSSQNAARSANGDDQLIKGAGKQMKEEDYHAISKHLEEITCQQQQGRMHGLGMQGNWRQPIDFQEFEPISLEDSKPRRKVSEPNKEGFKSLKNEGKKETLLLKVKMNSILVYVSHADVLSQENVKLQGGYHEAIQQLHTSSHRYFFLNLFY
ncbi:hypothetical protein WR25_26401 [Diploscapter pachys]|uniref:Autophagy-related protein 2 n=1 Tax=Diploscapter pachys TaxID=2018661 RepID=A0A2A2M119_9BILA|nr:hypothetical protein WR25_26401 [Diploscapter pachys]